MHCTVLRPINGPRGMIAAGQVVDTTAWRKRNRDVLIARQYLREEPTYALTHPDTIDEAEPETLNAVAQALGIPLTHADPIDEIGPEKTPGKKAR